MFNTHRFIAGFLSLVLLVTWPSLAYGQTISESEEMGDGDYTTVKKGDRVPYDGYLFEPAGVIKIMVNKSLELEKLKITKDSEINKLNIEIDFLKKQHTVELKIKEELHNNLIKIKEDRIKLLEDGNKWDDIKLFGALSLGIVLSVTIFFAAVQITSIKTQ